MERCWSQPPEYFKMRRRSITLMVFKAVFLVRPTVFAHK
jgi:hypothetical protein